MAPTYQTPLISITEATKGTVEVRLQRPRGFKYIAGQYISLVLNEVDTGNITDTFHEFSLASSPTEPDLVICTRRSNSPFKTALLAKKPGDQIEVQGPFGNFTAPRNNTAQLIAGGIGITPFRSIIISQQNAKFTLWYFNSSAETTVYLDELKQQPQLTLHSIVGQLDEPKLQGILNGPRPIMIAGPPSMVKKARETLMLMGILDKDILSEGFSGYD